MEAFLRDRFDESTNPPFPLDIVKYIIEQLATLDNKVELVNTKNEEGNTPLHWAALNGNLEVVEVLVKNGGDCKVKLRLFK